MGTVAFLILIILILQFPFTDEMHLKATLQSDCMCILYVEDRLAIAELAPVKESSKN